MQQEQTGRYKTQDYGEVIRDDIVRKRHYLYTTVAAGLQRRLRLRRQQLCGWRTRRLQLTQGLALTVILMNPNLDSHGIESPTRPCLDAPPYVRTRSLLEPPSAVVPPLIPSAIMAVQLNASLFNKRLGSVINAWNVSASQSSGALCLPIGRTCSLEREC